MLSDGSDDDSPLPSTRVAGRISKQALERASAGPRHSPRPLSQLQNGQRAARPSKAELLQRAQQVDRMVATLKTGERQPAADHRQPTVIAQQQRATARGQRAIQPSPLAALPQAAPLLLAPATAAEPEQQSNPSSSNNSPAAADASDVDLGLSGHLATFATLAAVPEGSSLERASALQAALGAAVTSLTTCEQQQSQQLRLGIDELKSDFRARLEALEAEFVRRAEELSAELAGAVSTRKAECIDGVSAHAAHLGSTILAIRGDDVGAFQEEPQYALLPPPRESYAALDYSLSRTQEVPRRTTQHEVPRTQEVPHARTLTLQEEEEEEEQAALWLQQAAARAAHAPAAQAPAASVVGARREARLEAGIDDYSDHRSLARHVANTSRAAGSRRPWPRGGGGDSDSD